MCEHEWGSRQAHERWGPDASEPRHVRGWRGRTRAAVARQLWDDHYAEIASGCAQTVPEAAIVHVIVQEAFVQLLCRWVPPSDPLSFVVERVAVIAQGHCDHQARAGSGATAQPADRPAARDVAVRVVPLRHSPPGRVDRLGGDRVEAAGQPDTTQVLLRTGRPTARPPVPQT